jgi:hypothetical protein
MHNLLGSGVDQTVLPSLVDFMAAKYRAAMEERNKSIKEDMRDSAEQAHLIDIEDEMRKIRIFLNFSNKYLTDFRPVELFYPEANYGIKLSNGELLGVAPAVTTERGTMQASSYAPVTGARYVQELEHGGAVPITGSRKATPKGLTDMTLPQAAVDRTANQPGKNYAADAAKG